MAIPDRFLDELIARTDIVDLVSESVRLTKKGRNYWGLCPFHSEKTPSFSVSADKQIYKCFGCGKGGGAINFVMELDNLPFRDAVAVLAKRAGLEVPDSGYSAGAKERREKLLAINKQAARTFHQWLYAPEGAEGLAYLQRRGLSRRTLTSFGLGFAPNRWDALIQALGQQGYDKRDLLDAGLAVSNQDGRIYDRFRNRVMFPIIDIRGEVIGFGGRVMDDSTPKYLNSPDTPVYNKSRNVFALNIAKKSKAGRVILTEGYMDTISLHQAGFDSAVASLGTSLTPEQVQKYTEHFKQPEQFISLNGQIVALPVEPENPLRTAEMTLEDDYGMIDGVLNNGRRGEELEKAQGEVRRTTPEKKPSIRERLAEAKKECSERKPPDKAHQKKPPEHDL